MGFMPLAYSKGATRSNNKQLLFKLVPCNTFICVKQRFKDRIDALLNGKRLHCCL